MSGYCVSGDHDNCNNPEVCGCPCHLEPVKDSTKLTLEDVLEKLDGNGLTITDWNEIVNTLISEYRLEITKEIE